jgi:hypothetical protein
VVLGAWPVPRKIFTDNLSQGKSMAPSEFSQLPRLIKSLAAIRTPIALSGLVIVVLLLVIARVMLPGDASAVLFAAATGVPLLLVGLILSPAVLQLLIKADRKAVVWLLVILMLSTMALMAFYVHKLVTGPEQQLPTIETVRPVTIDARAPRRTGGPTNPEDRVQEKTFLTVMVKLNSVRQPAYSARVDDMTMKLETADGVRELNTKVFYDLPDIPGAPPTASPWSQYSIAGGEASKREVAFSADGFRQADILALLREGKLIRVGVDVRMLSGAAGDQPLSADVDCVVDRPYAQELIEKHVAQCGHLPARITFPCGTTTSKVGDINCGTVNTAKKA